MSLITSESNFSLESYSSNHHSFSNYSPHSPSSPLPNQEGFSSSMILNLENEKISKPASKLINITQVLPGSKKAKNVLIPIFYRKSLNSSIQNNVLCTEKVMPTKIDECEEKPKNKLENVRPNRVTSTTFGSMHTLSNFDVEHNHEFFNEKVNYGYESELKSSIHEGNLIAYCHKCKKETVTVMQNEKFKGLKHWKEILMCCCSSTNNQAKVFMCPTCSEILLKTN